MEDNDGYSKGELLDEINKRKKINVNGKQYHIPRKLSDRIFGEPCPDIKRSKIAFENGVPIWSNAQSACRYRSIPLARAASLRLLRQSAEDFAEQLQSASRFKGAPLDDSEVNDICVASSIVLKDRNELQSRILREFYKKSKF